MRLARILIALAGRAKIQLLSMWYLRRFLLRQPRSHALCPTSPSSSHAPSSSLPSSPLQCRALSSTGGAGFYNFPPSAHYDLIVIGSGPAAQKCAIDSVKRGRRVAMIDKNSQMGGVCVHTGKKSPCPPWGIFDVGTEDLGRVLRRPGPVGVGRAGRGQRGKTAPRMYSIHSSPPHLRTQSCPRDQAPSRARRSGRPSCT